MVSREIKPCDCSSKEEIRSQIDRIDFELIKLFSLRYDFVKEIVKYKEKNITDIVAEDRKVLVIKQRAEWAEEMGLDKNTFTEIFRILLESNINKEMEIAQISNNKQK
ncbi:MAG: chorismate mutase [Prolixibacteraceae bacterium]|nr:chorismate mutase [Prolixibacteraceae bacterium]